MSEGEGTAPRISGWIKRLPFTLFAANGLLSLAQGSIEWRAQLAAWFEAWRSFVNPFAQTVLGWFYAPEPIPEWLGDYLVMGLIVGGGIQRVFISTLPPRSERRPIPLWVWAVLICACLVLGTLFWPLYVAAYVWLLFGFRFWEGDAEPFSRRAAPVFFEALAWALLVVVINYAILT